MRIKGEVAMTGAIDTTSNRHLSARLAAGLAIAALLVLGTFATSASAEERRDERRGEEHHRDRDHRTWGGGTYAAPPVVYGSPYYAPPPVVYGPGIGIALPGVSIGIR
jgi:hypothetical protein